MEQQHKEVDLGAAATALLLPEDLLAEVFRRLPPCSVAAFRCVCKTWRDIIDAHCLLSLHCLPHSVDSIVLNLYGLKSSLFLSRPTTGPATTANLDHTVSGELDHLVRPSVHVHDHCNGLLLVHDCVVNPATGQLARLPKCPPPCIGERHFFYATKYIVFDPLVSPYYEVFSIPRINHHYAGMPRDPEIEMSQWPPSTHTLHVFSSRTGRWEEKSFVREGEASGTVKSMRKDTKPRKRYAVYWQGALYVHCETNFVMRISMSTGKYHVIKHVTGCGRRGYPSIRLGRSENEVYSAHVQSETLQVWFLSESNGQMQWVLKRISVLWPLLPPQNYDKESGGTWTLHRVNSYQDEDNEAPDDVEEKIEMDLESWAILYNQDRFKHPYNFINLLGFHPYEEVVFLGMRFRRGLAYLYEEIVLVGISFTRGLDHKTSKITELENLCPPFYKYTTESPYIDASFMYTPCLVGKFPGEN